MAETAVDSGAAIVMVENQQDRCWKLFLYVKNHLKFNGIILFLYLSFNGKKKKSKFDSNVAVSSQGVSLFALKYFYPQDVGQLML